jgi:hypothetical protein
MAARRARVAAIAGVALVGRHTTHAAEGNDGRYDGKELRIAGFERGEELHTP